MFGLELAEMNDAIFNLIKCCRQRALRPRKLNGPSPANTLVSSTDFHCHRPGVVSLLRESTIHQVRHRLRISSHKMMMTMTTIDSQYFDVSSALAAEKRFHPPSNLLNTFQMRTQNHVDEF